MSAFQMIARRYVREHHTTDCRRMLVLAADSDAQCVELAESAAWFDDGAPMAAKLVGAAEAKGAADMFRVQAVMALLRWVQS